MAAVAATGYAGPLSLEIFNDQFRGGSAVADRGRRPAFADPAGGPACTGLAKAHQRTLGAQAQKWRHGFIEFAVNETKAGELARLLAQLGFRKTGKHRSKAVERWSQGKVELVVNSETDGFAHSHYVTHGPGVCAIALDVDNAGLVMQRAETLKARTFYQPVGPGELEIPAIHGVGGSLLYFLDQAGKNWNTDFEQVPSDARADALLAVDHIAQSMPYDEMLSWLLFYTGILDLERLPQMEIADPGASCKARPYQRRPSLRFVLNGSSANRTLPARFISEFFGSGVQHVAFSCRDIFAAVAEMRKRGADFLDIPDNYYDDIEAKYDLAPTDDAAARQPHSLRPRRRRRVLPGLHPSSTSASSSRSWSDGIIRDLARPMPGSGLRRRRARCGLRACRGCRSLSRAVIASVAKQSRTVEKPGLLRYARNDVEGA